MLLPFEIPVVFVCHRNLLHVSIIFKSLQIFFFFFCTRPEMHQFGRKNEKGKKKKPLHLFPIIHFFESRMFLGKNHQNTVLGALCVSSFNQLLWLSSLSLFQRLGLVLLKYFGFLIYLMFLFMNQHQAVVWFIQCFLFNMCFSKKVGAKAKSCLMSCAAV